MRRIGAIGAVLLLGGSLAHAHVGSPDVYAEGAAGPYHLYVVVRPPVVIPGVADVEVRVDSGAVERIAITPIPLTGEASKHPPVPDLMSQPSKDGQFYVGHLWIMSPGSWQIRFGVQGQKGSGVLSIPLPATAMATRTMQTGLGVFLAALGMLLVAGMIGIIGAATREARLAPGVQVPEANQRKARMAMGITFAVLTVAVVLGNAWWNSEARSYSGNVYKPLQMSVGLENGKALALRLYDPGWVRQRRLDDFIPDHDHLMHLYMIRWPEMDRVYHLHPSPTGTGDFRLDLPAMPAGSYRMYADVVHAGGFPETIVGLVTLPEISGRPLEGDDASGVAPAVENGSPRPVATALDRGRQRFTLADGYTMFWNEPDSPRARQPLSLQFQLRDPRGNPPADMELYMGMLGHAAIVKTDGSVFAHIHPTGTVAMAAFMMANASSSGAGDKADGMEMGSMPMMMDHERLPSTVEFPYGFPTVGTYRIFVQMKHGQTVETGVFDTVVQDARK